MRVNGLVSGRLALALVVAVLAACGGPNPDSPNPTIQGQTTPSQGSPSSPLPSPSAVETPAASEPEPLPVGSLVQVLVNGLRVRQEPGTGSQVVARLSLGQRPRILEGPREADGLRWYRVALQRTIGGGWIAEGDPESRWLSPVANGAITVASGRDILTLDQNGSEERLARLPRGWVAVDLSWSLDGRLLALTELRLRYFTQDACVIEGRVAVIDASGRRVAMSDPPDGTWDGGPVWSPDGSTVGFIRNKHTCSTADREGFPDLRTMTSEGGPSRFVTTKVDSPAWSPDGSLIAFTRLNGERSGFEFKGPEIWVVEPDGSGERLLGGRLDDGSREMLSEFVEWAPDGGAVTYQRMFGSQLNRVELGLINLAGEREVLQRRAGVWIELPIWAPDGSRLHYLQQAHLTSAIASVGPSGGDAQRIDIANGVPGSLVMSPDGSTIAWGVQGSSDVVLQPVDGSAPKTYQVSLNGDLAWRPILSE